MSMKNSMTPAGIEPATFRFVAQHLNHCATAITLGICFTCLLYGIMENKYSLLLQQKLPTRLSCMSALSNLYHNLKIHLNIQCDTCLDIQIFPTKTPYKSALPYSYRMTSSVHVTSLTLLLQSYCMPSIC